MGASLLAVAAARVARSGSDRRRLLLVVMAVYAAPIVVTGFFDRYLLPLLALAIVLVGSGDRRAWYWGIAGVAGSAALALVALAGTHEYLSWNRARWQALNELTDAQRIAPAEIDGGIEFDGWHFCQKRACASAPGKPWWYVQDDRWLIAFGPVEGYEEVFRVPYPRFGLSGRTMESLRALHRIEAPPASPEG